MNLALKHASVERSVSHLIFPDEVQELADEQHSQPGNPKGRLVDVHITPAAGSVDEAAREIAKAENPMIIVGHGARQSMPPVLELAEKIGAPVVTTSKAKGLVSDYHPLAGGVPGRSGTPIASTFMNQSDLLLVFGASFADHTGIDQSKPIIQMDFDRLSLARFHVVRGAIWGETGVTARLLAEHLPTRDTSGIREVVSRQWEQWRAEKQRRMQRDRGRGLNSATVFDILSRITPDDAVIAVDVGNNTYSFGRYFECT